jgi:drug/metabolite transporter (DMT)-like permease
MRPLHIAVGAVGQDGRVSRRGWVLFLAMSVIWGVPYLLIKVAVDEVSPAMVVFARCVVGAVLLLPWTIAKGQVRPALRHWKALLLFTLLEMAAPWLLLSYAEQTLSSSLTGLLVATVPFVAALAGRLAGEEDRLTPVRLLGMGLGVVGIVALLGLDIEGVTVPALIAVALTVVGYATGPLVVTRALPDVPGTAASSIALFITAVAYAPFAVPRLGEVADASPPALFSLVALGALCTALALALFFALIREVGPQRALVITFVNPAVAVLLGVALLDEPFTLGIAIGLPLILVGCVLATRRSEARRRPSELTEVDAAVP